MNKLTIIAGVLACLVISSSVAEKQNKQKPQSLTFAGSKYYPPLEWSDGTEARGFISELESLIAETSDTPYRIQLSQWSDALDSVLSGAADVVALIPSESRSQLYDFTQPFYYIAHGIFSHSDGPHFGSFEQLDGRTVAVVEKAFGEEKVHETIRQRDLNINVLRVATEHACVTAVANRQADACVEVMVSSNHLTRMYDLPVEMTSPPIWPQPYVFAVKKGNTEVLKLLNKQLAAIVVSGAYISLYKQWANELEWRPVSLWEKVKDLAQLLVALLIVAGLAIAWSLTLKRQVDKRTSELQRELATSNELRLQVSYQASHDFTTDLLNRRAFFELLNKELAELKKQPNKSLSVLAVQITNIADIITAFGYESALQTLNHVANKLRAIENSVAGHFGSGQYMLSYDGVERAQEIIRELKRPHSDTNSAIEPLLNFGITRLKPSEVPTNQSGSNFDVSEIVRQAITALAYATKKRLPYFEYIKSVEPESGNLQLINEFYRYGCEHFVLHYQPQLCVKTGKILHAEALVRWNHPALGMIAPYKFITLLENSGMIHVVTRWVVEQAVAMIQRNELEAKGCALSVNISTRDLIDDGFVDFVKSATRIIKPSSLILEITESDLFDDASRAKKAIIELRNLGVQFAVDDYGTGYSTLSYLNEFSIDEIKLDRSFVANIVSNERSRKIVKSTIDLAHELELVIVAEGVEDEQTVQVLKSLRCDRIQGYWIAKPMPEEQIIKLLNS